MVLKIDREYTNIHTLCERLVREIFIHSEKAKLSEECMRRELEKQAKVFKYVYDEWVKLKDETFCRKLFDHINGIFCISGEDAIMKCNLQTWHMLLLINYVTSYGMDSWIYSIQDFSDWAFVFGLISACENRYNLNEQKRETFQKLLEILESRLESSQEDLKYKSQSSVQFTVNDKSAVHIDQYGNTLFHYLCLYSEDEACQIIDKYIQSTKKAKNLKECLEIKNKEHIKPVHLAVALGKTTILQKMESIMDITMKGDKEGKTILKQILRNVKNVHIWNTDNKDLSAFDLNKYFDPEISRSVTRGRKEDFEKVFNFFPDNLIEHKLERISRQRHMHET